MIIACLLVISAGIVLNVFAWRRVRNEIFDEYHRRDEQISRFFAQPSKDEPSDFNKILLAFADMVVERQRVNSMAVERGVAGAAARDINRGLEEIAVENNPALGLMEVLPKSLKKNSTAQAGLYYLINHILAQKQAGKNGKVYTGSGSAQTKFDL